MERTNGILRFTGRLLLLAAAVLLATTPAQAAPPHPDLLDRIETGKADMPFYLANLKAMHEKGVSTGKGLRPDPDGVLKLVPTKSPSVAGTFKVLAILVEFSDNPASVSASYFDSLLFDSLGNSVRNYYGEASYGQLDLVSVNMPTSLGWQTAPQTYEYYVNGQNGTGSYPRNSQGLVEDLVAQIDPVVDFSQYDNDGDNYVDVLIVIHAGTGAEKSGSADDIWSHKWAIVPDWHDGVYISDYTVQPELWTVAGDMTIGVYAHELGHAFGLPDLYDTDNSSRGIGTWGIMAYGSWLGPGNLGGSPSYPCAWSRVQLGFATPTNITVNTNAKAIQAVETSGEIYRLWTSGADSDEYYLVENRRRIGYDSYLYGEGLLIWHIDDAKATNNNTDNTEEWWPGQPDSNHYRVALEQADGLWELEHRTDHGDGNDPFPGGLNVVSFDATTTPSSDSYVDGTSFVKVDNISAPAATMYADLIVGFAADVDDEPLGLPNTVELAQNYPNPFNPSTQISFTLSASAGVRLDVFNLQGRLVRTLLDGPAGAGTTTVTWDARSDNGNQVGSGVYFYRLRADGVNSQTRKMILLK